MLEFLRRLLSPSRPGGRAAEEAPVSADATNRPATSRARDDPEANREDLERAHARDPDDDSASIALGIHLAERGEHGRAVALVGRAVASSPRHPSAAAAHRALGLAHAGLGDRAAAISHFDEAFARGLHDESLHCRLCVLLYQGGELQRAADVARRGVAAFPDSAELHVYLGNLAGFAGDLVGAVHAYERALAIGPPSAETLYNLGVILGKLDRTAEAIASYRRALALEPARVAAHLNLANAFRKVGRPTEAFVHYAEATRLAPASVEAHLAEGNARLAAGDAARAMDCLERARALVAGDARVHVAMGTACQDLGKRDEAIRHYEEALRLLPGDVDALLRLGNVLLHRGDTPRAIERYREALARDPHCGVAHLVTALTGGDTERAPDAYVARLFDGYADRFDSHLVKDLRYEIPHLIAGMLQRQEKPSGAGWDVLDLGCGTGLVGSKLAPFARRIVGVDLSPGMLAKAREAGHYERLEAAELVEMMRNEPASAYDVVTAADVFVYVGKLDDAAREIARVLRPAGHVAFSVESLDASQDAADGTARQRGYRLQSSGRYAHSIAYLRRLAEEHGFEFAQLHETPIRLEAGKPVDGYVVLWRCRDASH